MRDYAWVLINTTRVGQFLHPTSNFLDRGEREDVPEIQTLQGLNCIDRYVLCHRGASSFPKTFGESAGETYEWSLKCQHTTPRQ